MIYILTGSIAFVWHALYDRAQMYKRAWPKSLFIISALTLLFGINGILSSPAERTFSSWLRGAACIGLAIFLPLLIYSVLIEIPLKIKHSNYEQGGKRLLIDTGTYALSRHPGVLWFAGAAICMVLLHPSGLTFCAGITWTAMDILLAWAEDRYFFPNTFPDYAEYKTRTPFLIPNKSSLYKCRTTIKNL